MQFPSLKSSCRSVLLLLALAVLGAVPGLPVAESWAQTTYTWNVSGSGTWGIAANWTPARTTPASNDILVIDGSLTPNPTLTQVFNQTIGKLVLVNNARATLTASPPNPVSLTISGGAGTDLDVPAGCLLRAAASPTISFIINPGATGLVTGEIEMTAAAHRLFSPGSNALVFEFGGMISVNPGFTGNVFGTSPSGGVLFRSGSQYISRAGADPFGAPAPSSVVTFEPGSLYRHVQTAAPSLAGRTYGDFVLDAPSYNSISTGSSEFVVDNLTVLAGQFRLRLLMIRIRGDVFVQSGATLEFSPTLAQALRFSGSSPQLITNPGSLTFNANTNIFVENTGGGVTLASPLTLAGPTTVASTSTLATQAPLTNNGPMTVNGSFQLESGGSASGSAFAYGPASTLVFNNLGDITFNGAPYWPAPSPPKNVTIQGGGRVFIESQAPPITGILTLTSGVAYPLFPLVIANGGSVSGGSAASHVSGTLQKFVGASGTPVTVNFEIGDGTLYAPVALDLPTVDGAGFLSASTMSGEHFAIDISGLDASRSANRLWTVANVNADIPPCSAVFTFDPLDVDPGADPLSFQVKTFNPPNVWTAQTVGNRTSFSTEITGVTTLGEFAIAEPAWVIQTSTGPNGGIFPNLSVFVQDGDDQHFDIEPSFCHVVEDVLVDGVSVGPVTEYTFTNVTADHTIHATFMPGGCEFTEIGAGLAGISNGPAVWGDYDNDGDLDLLLVGHPGTRLYRNDGGSFTEVPSALPYVYSASAAWGDFDNDGDLDIVISGMENPTPVSRIYRNDAGSFVDIAAGLVGVYQSSVAWGDYDNDGDLDLLLAGLGASPTTMIYRNDNGSFTDIAAGLTGTYFGSAAWADYDGDGDLDAAVAGDSDTGFVTTIYRNDGGTFVDIGAGLTGVRDSCLAWGDYDNDGDLDIYVSGFGLADIISKLYRNDAGSFVDGAAGIQPLYGSSGAWGDFDNDGDLDLAASGAWSGTMYSKVYRNDSGAFIDIGAPLAGTYYGSLAWGDYDNDSDLDLLVAGEALGGPVALLYRNNSSVPNTLPSPPDSPTAMLSGGVATFSWAAATDAETPPAGLTYNLRIGTTPGGSEISSAMADLSNGYRRVPRIGNAGHRLTWSGELPPAPQYYWSVQAVDAGFSGSPFTAQQVLQPAQFVNIGAGLPGVADGTTTWGDYDNDGDLDLLLAGSNLARIYRNDSGVFIQQSAGLPNVGGASAAWGDFDNDGDLDVALSGTQSPTVISRIYRNDAGTFVDHGAGLPGANYGSVDWGDYDNDGDLDLLLTGYASNTITRVYRNDDGSFVDIAAGLAGTFNSEAAWGDYDNDGDLDIAVTGWGTSSGISLIYRNDNGVFVDIGAGLTGLFDSHLAWGDYDNDSDLDLVLSGAVNVSTRTSILYRNDGGSFVDAAAGLAGFQGSAAGWGDFDNDGDLDLAISGFVGGGAYSSRIYRNESGLFVDINAGTAQAGYGSLAWGDYDNDSDLDLIVSGNTSGGPATILYRNDSSVPNTLPSPPSSPTAILSGNVGTFSWAPASDSETPAAGLTYNLRIGTTPGGSEISSAMSDLSNGYRRVARIGNAGHRLSWSVELPPAPGYYWSVQAVDAALAGSPFAAQQVLAQPAQFVDIAAGLPGFLEGSAAWGDYDSDGDLDIAMSGHQAGNPFARIYRNDSGSFVDLAAGLSGVFNPTVAWGDYDNDGDLDLLVAGYTIPFGYLSRIYRNDAGVFTNINAPIVHVGGAAGAWSDFDGDGDLDLLLTGTSSMGVVTRLYRNDDGSFSVVAAGLPPVTFGSVAWGDYDNDGDPDILICGDNGTKICRIYRNDNGAFVDAAAGLPGIFISSVAWGDYDSDGDLDVLLSGETQTSTHISRIYRNDGGSFTDIAAGLPGTQWSSVGWGDFDNDGDLDVLLAGDGPPVFSRIYRNDGGTFIDAAAGLPGVFSARAAWGDYDNDGDLDIFLSGVGGPTGIARIYRNDTPVANTPPAAPTGVSSILNGSNITFSWSPSTDAQTPPPGLTYNLRIATTPGGSEIASAMSDLSNGYRRVPELGNTNHRLSWTISLSELEQWGPIYWSVQAVDAAFAGSPFTSGGPVSGIGDRADAAGSDFMLRAGQNPFRRSTRLEYALPAASQVLLEVFDVNGRLVKTVEDGARPAGRHAVAWNATDDRGRTVPAGVYVARLKTGAQIATQRLVLAR